MRQQVAYKLFRKNSIMNWINVQMGNDHLSLILTISLKLVGTSINVYMHIYLTKITHSRVSKRNVYTCYQMKKIINAYNLIFCQKIYCQGWLLYNYLIFYVKWYFFYLNYCKITWIVVFIAKLFKANGPYWRYKKRKYI